MRDAPYGFVYIETGLVLHVKMETEQEESRKTPIAQEERCWALGREDGSSSLTAA